MDYQTRHREVVALQASLERDFAGSLQSLHNYTSHESEDLRRDVYAMLWRMGSASDDGQTRRIIVDIMLEGVRSDNSFIRGQILKWLQDFEQADFGERAISILKNLPLQQPDASAVIRLIGIAKIQETVPLLRSIADQKIDDEAAAQWFARSEWAARLALARMGDVDGIQRVVSKVDDAQDIVVRATILFKDLAYTRRPAAFDALRRYLNSDHRLPALRSNMKGRLEACYAAAVLAEHLENFPDKKTDFDESDLARVRTWANAQREWKIR
jgi:hypothetical protein